MKYSIGQILYILMNRETKILPVQVIEEITKKSLNGESTNYIVRVGSKGEATSLSDIDGEIFDSIIVLRQTLHEKIIKMVDSVVENSEKRAKEWYQIDDVDSIISEPIEKAIEIQQDDAVVILPDGTKSKIKMAV